MFIEINRIIKLSHCFKYWSGNAPGRSARSRPLAAARLAPVAPRTRTIGIDTITNCFNLFEYVSIRFNPFQSVSIRFNLSQSISIRFNLFQSDLIGAKIV